MYYAIQHMTYKRDLIKILRAVLQLQAVLGAQVFREVHWLPLVPEFPVDLEGRSDQSDRCDLVDRERQAVPVFNQYQETTKIIT